MKNLKPGDRFNPQKTGENIRRIRKSYRNTQNDLAKKLQCSQSYIAKLECGEIPITIDMAIAICCCYNLNLENLLIINDEPFPTIQINISSNEDKT